MHLDKTFIGRIKNGSDFLGCHFSPKGTTVARKAMERFVERAIRLYEQGPGEADASAQFGLYVQRWVRWTRAGLGETLNTGLQSSLKADAARFVPRRV